MDIQKQKPLFIFIGITVAIIAVGAFFFAPGGSRIPSGTYDELAQCISDSGAKFYGAFWCPHCQEQKEAFGDSVKLLPYIECSTPDGRGQTQVCKDANITSYPTWEFSDGTRVTGNIALTSLAEATGCEVPKLSQE